MGRFMGNVTFYHLLRISRSMKKLVFLLTTISILFYSLQSYSQKWDLSGEWVGYVTQEVGLSNIYYCKLNLEQFGDQIKGGSYFDLFNDKEIFVTFSLKGTIQGDIFHYQEIKVLEHYIPSKYSGKITAWCIKKADLKITETQDSLKLEGHWTGVPHTGEGYCYPGEFYVKKPKPKLSSVKNQNPSNNQNIIFELPQEVHKGDKFIIPNIHFKPSAAELLPESYASLDKLVGYLKSRPELKIKIVGHTDIGKDDAYNQTLSKARAEAVKAYIVRQGVVDFRISTEGKGNKQPIASNDTSEGRAKNRRVEIVIEE
ncbi:MAG: hypothetical protein KatS3mg035_0232 [Bacteroidia bacterium]|nr:MAG: hypothetical protein KatS3mg035_0232 [Bacteroidia bacterium]